MEDCLVCYALPAEHRKTMLTANWLERVNQELRRRPRPMGALPSCQRLWRIAAVVLVDLNEKWLIQKWCWPPTSPQPLGERRLRPV